MQQYSLHLSYTHTMPLMCRLFPPHAKLIHPSLEHNPIPVNTNSYHTPQPNTKHSNPTSSTSPPPPPSITQLHNLTNPLLPAQPFHKALSPMLVLSPHAIAATLTQLNTLSKGKRQRNTHIPHHTIPLTITYLHHLELTPQQTNTNLLNVSIIFHFMTAIDNPTLCQPNRRLLVHLNNHTYTLTPNTHHHHPTKIPSP